MIKIFSPQLWFRVTLLMIVMFCLTGCGKPPAPEQDEAKEPFSVLVVESSATKYNIGDIITSEDKVILSGQESLAILMADGQVQNFKSPTSTVLSDMVTPASSGQAWLETARSILTKSGTSERIAAVRSGGGSDALSASILSVPSNERFCIVANEPAWMMRVGQTYEALPISLRVDGQETVFVTLPAGLDAKAPWPKNLPLKRGDAVNVTLTSEAWLSDFVIKAVELESRSLSLFAQAQCERQFIELVGQHKTEQD